MQYLVIDLARWYIIISELSYHIWKYDFPNGIPWNFEEDPHNSLGFIGTFCGKMESSTEFHGIWGHEKMRKSSMKSHGILNRNDIPWNFSLCCLIPWDNMEPQMLIKCWSKRSMEFRGSSVEFAFVKRSSSDLYILIKKLSHHLGPTTDS